MLKPAAYQLVLLAALGGCASSAKLPVSAGTGTDPTLPPPERALIPVVHVVKATGWPEGAKPVAAEGTAVTAFARDLDHPRWLPSLPEPFRRGMFVGQHGSWNRKPRSGYKVILVPFASGKPSGDPIDVLTGFVKDNGEAMGRPVGVAIDKRGALLMADDVGNVIWRVTSAE